MKKIAGYLIAIVLIIATIIFGGWVLNMEYLKRPFDHTKMMNPVTALSMIMACTSYFLLYKRNPGKKTFIAGKVLAFGVFGIALIKLSALTGLQFDLDAWLFDDPILRAGVATTHASQSAIINSSVGFFITGLALLLSGLNRTWPNRLITFLGLFGFVVGTFTCIGFIYHINEFYGILPYMSVAPTTSLCFILFSMAMMLANNDAGFMAALSSKYLGGRIARGLIPIGVGVPVIFGYIGLYLSWWMPFSAALGTALLSGSIVVVFLVVLWFLARALNTLDAEREAAEMQLQRQAQLFNVIPDAVIYGNKDLTVTSMNPTARKIFGVSNEEIGKVKLDDVFAIEMKGTTRDAVRRELWGEKGFWRGESNLITRDGKKISTMTLLKAIVNEAGEKVGWVGVYTDISFLRVNEELQAANNYLEQLAFISAHDIKSPILTLQGLVNLVTETEKLSPQNQKALMLQKNVINQMQETNKALSEILKLRQKLKEKNSDEVAHETRSVSDVIQSVTGLLENEIAASGAKLEIEIKPVAGIQVQQVYFHSLFHNLLSNSVKYRDPLRPVIIKLTGIKPDAETIQFIIEDNGLGIDLVHNRKRLYGMFKRFHSHVEGTGVGLHIVKSIVDAFGGTIEIESQPNQGTRFEITFKAEALG